MLVANENVRRNSKNGLEVVDGVGKRLQRFQGFHIANMLAHQCGMTSGQTKGIFQFTAYTQSRTDFYR